MPNIRVCFEFLTPSPYKIMMVIYLFNMKNVQKYTAMKEKVYKSIYALLTTNIKTEQ